MLNTEHCQEYLGEVRAQADKMGMRGSLEKQLEYLATYACHTDLENTRCDLFKDFAPLSFGFTMYVKDEKTGEYKRWFNGGCLFYNAGESGVSGPQFSCRLDSRESGWTIHT
jgi:hypothetical protein